MFATRIHVSSPYRPTLKSVAGTALAGVAAIVLGAATLMAASGSSQAGPPPASFKDRFAAVVPQPDCSGASWPYLSAECLRMPDGSRAQAVRVISVDRPALQRAVVVK